MAAAVYDWFWSESIWLPPNVTWKDMGSDAQIHMPRALDLLIVFPCALVLFAVRLVWESFLALPIGRYFNLRECPPRKAIPSTTMEKAYKQNGKVVPKHDIIVGIAKQMDWSPRQVERWWRRRKAQNKPSEMQRFKETSWRFVFYLTASWYGLIILWNKSWFWDTRNCWYGYPRQNVTLDVSIYYMVELGFYWSLVLSIFMDAKRHDFMQMMLHHFATISLLTMSYVTNMIRIGTLVLAVHDIVDYWLEGAKMTKYCKYHKLCDGLFVVFTVLWFITRLCIYPYRVLYSSIYESYEIVGAFALHRLFNGLLAVLQILHVFWFYTILCLVHEFITKGEVEKDERSDTEPETDSEDEGITVREANSSISSRRGMKLPGGDNGHANVNNNLLCNGVNGTK